MISLSSLPLLQAHINVSMEHLLPPMLQAFLEVDPCPEWPGLYRSNFASTLVNNTRW